MNNIFVMMADWMWGLFGNCDSVLAALCIFIVIRYITDTMYMRSKKCFNKKTIQKEIRKTTLIFLLIIIANTLDTKVIGNIGFLRSLVILFYIPNEGIAILNNAVKLDLPVPQVLKTVLKELQSKAEGSR